MSIECRGKGKEMDLQRVVKRLENADSPSRSLDAAIAEVIGWKKRVEETTDPKTGEKRVRTLWLVPAGDDVGRVPHYTSNLQDAFDLAHAIRPSQTGGCSWVDGRGTAILGEGEYSRHRVPPWPCASPRYASCSQSNPARRRGRASPKTRIHDTAMGCVETMYRI